MQVKNASFSLNCLKKIRINFAKLVALLYPPASFLCDISLPYYPRVNNSLLTVLKALIAISKSMPADV